MEWENRGQEATRRHRGLQESLAGEIGRAREGERPELSPDRLQVLLQVPDRHHWQL